MNRFGNTSLGYKEFFTQIDVAMYLLLFGLGVRGRTLFRLRISIGVLGAKMSGSPRLFTFVDDVHPVFAGEQSRSLAVVVIVKGLRGPASTHTQGKEQDHSRK